MKKLSITLLTSSLLFSTVNLEAHAGEYVKSINYIESKETIQKVKDGNIALHGMKIGDYLSKFTTKKYKDSHRIVDDFYTEAGAWVIRTGVGADKGFTDFQQNKPFNKLKITRLNDDYNSSPYRLYKDDIRKHYGKPSKDNTLRIGNPNSGYKQVDVYKNVTFIYTETKITKSNPKLTYVVIMKNNTKTKLNNWKNYLKNNKFNRINKNFEKNTIMYDSYGKYTKGRSK
ncbi:hypothetical protein AB4G91_07855 [Macrococcoides goetzii]|uniref:hypothetical protein n=1 Tax=Macrococcus TaxID=69965 RepID=UPI001EF2AD29|nr:MULTISPECIES: hypothetical protein [Macrococcus]MCG7419603.1 hypothetical protein [Macrococcus epidermidis]MCH4984423.1 hypothetical protein [Macrococcus sp. PK]MCH4985176.1 hypothetical protein [Macrococcus sp. PK]